MFELFEEKLMNLFRTYRSMARQIYKKVDKEDKYDEKLAAKGKKLQADVQTGNVDLVKQDIQEELGTLRELIKLTSEIENLDILFCNEMGESLLKEYERADKINALVDHIKIDPKALKGPDEFTDAAKKKIGKGVKTVSDYKNLLKTEIKRIIDYVRELHRAEMAQTINLIEMARSQHMDISRVKNQIFSNFGEYKAEQYARVLRWQFKGEQKESK